MVQLKTLITLYFPFTLRFLAFILGQTSQGTVNFFFSLWHKKHLGAAVQQHLLCPKCKNIFPTAALAQWSNTKHHSILATDYTEVPWARAPAKAHQLLERHNCPLQPQKRSTDPYFPNQTPLPNNNDPLEQSRFYSFLLQWKRVFLNLKREWSTLKYHT